MKITADDELSVTDAAYAYVCDEVVKINQQFTCEGFDKPVIIVTGLLNEMDLVGAYYPGDPFVFINPESEEPLVVLLHEMAHYVLYHNGLSTERKCLHELLARTIAGDDDDEWRAVYGCPEE